MDWSFFLKGILLGFSIAAPVGPIGALCIRRTFQYGRWSGLCSGLGAATADTIYGIIAAFGLTLISNFLLEYQFWLRLIGGIFLLYLGAKVFFSKTAEITHTHVTHKTLFSDYISTFFLTITNPLTIISYLAVFAGLGLTSTHGHYAYAIQVVIGVFLGSGLWWLILAEGITLFRKRITPRIMTWVNRVAGVTIGGFGVFALSSVFFV